LNHERQIWVFGNPDKTELGFPDRADLVKYLANDIFEKESGRYRYTLARFVDIIVISRDGLAFGHFDILEKVPPTDSDRAAYPRVKHVYRVSKSSLYAQPIPLSELGVKLGRFGHRMTEEQFSQLLGLAGEVVEYSGGVRLPASTLALERLFQEVKRRLGQSEFRASLIDAYGGKCVVTGCDVVDVLEAAHIVPHCEVESNDPSEGLLLRADIHTLFDRHLLGINPATKAVQIAKTLLSTSYGEFDGARVAGPLEGANQPSKESLETRWKIFLAQER
jgi:hypothetical protein